MRSWPKVIAVTGCVAVAGCGAGTNHRDLGLTNIPLPAGARIAASVRVCDRGANPYCSEQVVVVGERYPTSADLLNTENAHLKTLGWTESRGDTGKQLAVESPGHELRMTLDTAYNDLIALDTGQILRAAATGRALSAVLFDRAPAISLMLERGSS
jgi:hypothetical protein